MLIKTVLGGSVNGLFAVVLWIITIEKDVIYNLTVNQNVITRYVKVIQTFTPIFSAFYVHFGTFSNITLVCVVKTSWFTADLLIIIHSIIWYRFYIHLRPSTDPQEAIFTKKYSIFMTCSLPIDT